MNDVTVVVESVARHGVSDDVVAPAVADAVESARLRLGLPVAAVRNAVVDGRDRPAEFLRLLVDGRLVSVVEDDARAAYDADRGRPVDPQATGRTVWSALARKDAATVRRVVHTSCQAAVERTPAPLVGLDDVAELLGDGRWELSVDPLLLIRQLAARGVGFRRWSAAMSEVLDAGDEAKVAEMLAERLEPRQVRVAAAPDMLRRLSVDLEGRGLLATVRGELLADTGVPVPDIVLEPDHDVPPSCWRFGVGPLLAGVHAALAAGDVFVYAPPALLAEHGLSGWPAVDPVSRTLCAVTDAPAAHLAAAGLTSLDGVEYFALTLSGFLRSRADRLVRTSSVAELLSRLGTVRPALVDAVLTVWDIESITTAIRDVVASGGSVGALAPAMEALGDVAAGWLSGELADVVRRAVAVRTVRRYGGQTLTCYLLTPELEAGLGGGDSVPDVGLVADGPWVEALTGALLRELTTLPPGARGPVVLAGDDCRPGVAAALAARVPGTAVLGYADVPADHIVRPVARMAAPRADL